MIRNIEKLRDSNRMTTGASVTCHRLFAVCRLCDRGRRYCGPECARQARLTRQREASRAYQSTGARPPRPCRPTGPLLGTQAGCDSSVAVGSRDARQFGDVTHGPTSTATGRRTERVWVRCSSPPTVPSASHDGLQAFADASPLRVLWARHDLPTVQFPGRGAPPAGSLAMAKALT